MKINVREGGDPVVPKKTVEVKLSSTSVIYILLVCILGLSLTPIIVSFSVIGTIFVGGILILLGLLFGLLVICEEIGRVISSTVRRIRWKLREIFSMGKKSN